MPWSSIRVWRYTNFLFITHEILRPPNRVNSSWIAGMGSGHVTLLSTQEITCPLNRGNSIVLQEVGGVSPWRGCIVGSVDQRD